MAQNIKSIYAIALIIASVASTAIAISCHRCDSFNDFNCRNSLNYSREFLSSCEFELTPSYITDGYEDIQATGCLVKNVEEDGELKVIRPCYWGDIPDQERGCRNPPWTTYTTLSCYVCDTDGCNSNIEIYEMNSSSATESIAVLVVLFCAGFRKRYLHIVLTMFILCDFTVFYSLCESLYGVYITTVKNSKQSVIKNIFLNLY